MLVDISALCFLFSGEALKRETEEQLETRVEETDLSKLSSYIIDNTDEDPSRPPPDEEGDSEEEKDGEKINQ